MLNSAVGVIQEVCNNKEVGEKALNIGWVVKLVMFSLHTY